MLVGVMLDTDYAAGGAGGQVFYSAESRKAHFQTALDEAADLVRAAGGELVAVETSKRDRPHSALLSERARRRSWRLRCGCMMSDWWCSTMS